MQAACRPRICLLSIAHRATCPVLGCSRTFAPTTLVVYSAKVMFEDFIAKDRWTGQDVHCVYQATISAIATRHADAIDIKFLANNRPIWIALSHPAWTEYRKRTNQTITDPLAVQIAGHYLKTIIEDGEESGREVYSLNTAETLDHLDAVMKSATAAGIR